MSISDRLIHEIIDQVQQTGLPVCHVLDSHNVKRSAFYTAISRTQRAMLYHARAEHVTSFKMVGDGATCYSPPRGAHYALRMDGTEGFEPDDDEDI